MSGGSFWGHLLVSLCACVLTVSIVGSAVFLAWRVYDRRQLKDKVTAFVESLGDRTPEELAEQARLLKALPKVARHMLPEIARTIRSARDENRQRAAIEISKAFLDDENIVKTLMSLRTDPRETVAAAAVRALADSKPEEKAASMVGVCLGEAQTAAARDQACASLYELGEPGRLEMTSRVGALSQGRRIWLAKFVEAHPGAQQDAWLLMLAADQDERVRAAAAESIRRIQEEAGEAGAAKNGASVSAPRGDAATASAAESTP